MKDMLLAVGLLALIMLCVAAMKQNPARERFLGSQPVVNGSLSQGVAGR